MNHCNFFFLLKNHEQELLVRKRWAPQGRLPDVQQWPMEGCFPGESECFYIDRMHTDCVLVNVNTGKQTVNCLPSICRMIATLSSMAGSLCGLQTLTVEMPTVCACRTTVTWTCTIKIISPIGAQALTETASTSVVLPWQIRVNWCWKWRVQRYGTLMSPEVQNNIFEIITGSILGVNFSFQ